jgi:hypothetical protein
VESTEVGSTLPELFASEEKKLSADNNSVNGQKVMSSIQWQCLSLDTCCIVSNATLSDSIIANDFQDWKKIPRHEMKISIEMAKIQMGFQCQIFCPTAASRYLK